VARQSANFRQLRDRVVAMILDGVLQEGDPLPSVRNVAAECRINPLTVLKAYQQLVDEQFVETKRGLGMFVKAGARNLLLKANARSFSRSTGPESRQQFSGLASHQKELLAAAKRRSSSKTAKEER